VANTNTYKAPAMTSVSNDDDFGGWGSNEGTTASASGKPNVSQDDDFGGWSSAPAPTTPAATSASGNKAPAADDLFGNVWG
jgi:stromal membrane-associated protein